MKICEDHFDAVEQAIIARGLGDLIPSPGDNHRLLRAWGKGILTLETFDPVSLALGCIRRVMTETAAAHPEIAEGISMSDCPLCWVDEKQTPDPEQSEDLQENWLLDFGVDCACDFARKLSKPQREGANHRRRNAPKGPTIVDGGNAPGPNPDKPISP